MPKNYTGINWLFFLKLTYISDLCNDVGSNPKIEYLL